MTAEALDAALAGASDSPQLVDTTGSVVYLGPALLERLRGATRVVYLRTPREAHEEMRARYLAEPKPVVWSDAWGPAAGETEAESLARCYEGLLAQLDARYLALAHVVVDGRALRDGSGVDLATLAGTP